MMTSQSNPAVLIMTSHPGPGRGNAGIFTAVWIRLKADEFDLRHFVNLVCVF